jgi:hypothetical protein
MDRGREIKWDQVIEFHVTSPVCVLRVVQKYVGCLNNELFSVLESMRRRCLGLY